MNENTAFNNTIITAFGIMVMIAFLCTISSLTSCNKIDDDNCMVQDTVYAMPAYTEPDEQD
jgi:hypothetical protein